MKKTILLLAMFVGANFANAQTTVFDDFNTTRANYWNFYNSNYISAPEVNPSAVGNTSTEVGKYTRIVPTVQDDEYQGLGGKQAGWAGFDFFTSYNTVKVDVYAAQAFELKLVLQDNGGTSIDVETVTQNYTVNDINTWKTLTFDFSANSNYILSSGNAYAILWKFDDGLMNTVARDYYVDNFVGVTVVASVFDKKVNTVSKLIQNTPNPFSVNTTIDYSLSQSGEVSLNLFDAMGRPVSNLIENKFQSSGEYTYALNAASMNEGVYYYTLTVGDAVETRRMVIQK